MASVNISLLEPGEERAWDSFIEASPSGTFFHRAGWKRVIEKAFGHRTFYLLARRRGQICGVLPLTQIKSLLFGNSLISNAFCVHGGPVADEPAVRENLVHKAVSIANELRLYCVELRSGGTYGADWRSLDSLYASFRRPVSSDTERNLKLIPRKQRAMIRKAVANGLRSEVDGSVSRFHHVYAQSVRNLGTPVFAKRYFQLLKDEFGAACDLLTVFQGTEAIASVLNFYFRNAVLPYYGGGTQLARTLAGNDFMYWEVMRRACERGFCVFDFGRSKVGTGSYEFKRNWGFEPIPIAYTYYSPGRRDVGGVNPLNPKYRAAINVWRRLPLPVTKLLGPPIVRSIG
jgi:FemAB-related protein (PEP-CTERM system-associated)